MNKDMITGIPAEWKSGLEENTPEPAPEMIEGVPEDMKSTAPIEAAEPAPEVVSGVPPHIRNGLVKIVEKATANEEIIDSVPGVVRNGDSVEDFKIPADQGSSQAGLAGLRSGASMSGFQVK